MTDYDDYEDDDQDVPTLLKDLRKQLKVQSQKNKALEDQLAEQTTKARGASLKEYLKAAGVPEKVASLVPSSVEPTPEGVGDWLKEYGDVFGVTQGTTSPPEGQEDPEVLANAQKMSQMQNTAATGEIKGQARQVTQADLKAVSSEAELWDLIRKGAAQGS